MDVPLDPARWIIGFVLEYFFFAVFLVIGTISIYYLLRFYFGQAPDQSHKDIYKEQVTSAESARSDIVHCPKCGARVSAEGAYCEWCGSGNKVPSPSLPPSIETVGERLHQQTQSSAAARAPACPVTYLKAPLGRRYLAALVDSFVAVGPALSGVVLLVLSMKGMAVVERYPLIAYASMLLMGMAYIFMLGGTVWFFLYYLLKDAWKDGAGLGKQLFGLMVIDIAANIPCNKRQSIIRTIGLFLPLTQLIDPLAVLQDTKGRRVGDHLAGTQVIDSHDYHPSDLPLQKLIEFPGGGSPALTPDTNRTAPS